MKHLNNLLSVFLAIFLLCASGANAKIWYVNKDGSGDSQSIGWALVAQAASGDTILVSPGDYLESGLHINKSIFLISEAGPETTIIRHLGVPGNENYQVIFIMDATGLVCIDGFTITGATGGHDRFGGAISIYRSDVLIRNNIITGNWCASGGGICFSDSPPNATVENNLIYLNEASHGGGIYIRDGSPIIRNNTIVGNTAYGNGGGIYIDSDSHPIIEHNIIAHNVCSNSDGGGVATETPETNVDFSCNNVWSNTPSNYYRMSDRTGLDGNISVDPMFCGEYGTGNYYLQAGSPCAEPNVPEYCAGLRIGYYPINCETGTEIRSWGSIKKRIRIK